MAGQKRQRTPSPGRPAISDGEPIKWWWVYGPGAKKWSTFTELHKHLTKHLDPGMADRVTAAWYHARYGRWPGKH